MAEHVAVDNGLPVAIFSMEMGASQLAMRMLGSIARVDQHKMRTWPPAGRRVGSPVLRPWSACTMRRFSSTRRAR
jgi:hypothetical protein